MHFPIEVLTPFYLLKQPTMASIRGNTIQQLDLKKLGFPISS